MLPILAQAELPYSATPRTYRVGDDLAWAAPVLPDPEAWTADRPREPGNWWMRTTLTLERAARLADDVALRVYAPGALEIFWDGSRVGGDGVIGRDADAERPGRHGVWASLDPSIVTAGAHVVAVRVSSHRKGRVQGPLGILLLNRAATQQVEGQRTAFFLFCAGLLIFAGAVFGLLYRPTGARVDTLLFATLTVVVGGLLLLEYAKFVHAYPYTWHFSRLVAISSLTVVVGVLLPVFVAAHLRIGRLTALAAVLAAAYLGIMFVQADPDVHCLSILRAAIGVAVVLALVGAVLRRPGAPWILVACTANLVPVFFTGFRYADHWFFVGFLGMVAVLLFRMGRTLRRQAGERDAALLRVERLRYELLRKTIQPHFLMNSLAVAISYIEEAPARGIGLLRDLAGELELFLRMSDREFVPLAEELELCRMHAGTMEHLLDRRLELTIDTDGTSFEIPPGVLLTLVENAITHGRLADDGRISIRVRHLDGVAGVEVENRATRPVESPVQEKAGLCFVRAQLERDPTADWEIEHDYRDGFWTTRLRRREARG